MELALHGPLVILEAMLNGGCPGSAKFDFRIPVSDFTVEGCVGTCEFAVSTLRFLSEGDDECKGDPVDCGFFWTLLPKSCAENKHTGATCVPRHARVSLGVIPLQQRKNGLARASRWQPATAL